MLEVYETAKKAVNFCRKGGGPVFIECITYRLRGHVGPDDNIQGFHTDIRSKEEVDKWKKKDPIPNFENYLLRNKILDKNDIINLHKQVKREIEESYLFARNSPYPEKNELGKYLFKE